MTQTWLHTNPLRFFLYPQEKTLIVLSLSPTYKALTDESFGGSIVVTPQTPGVIYVNLLLNFEYYVPFCFHFVNSNYEHYS